MDHKGVFDCRWERLGIWIAIGLVIYFAYGRFQSRLRAK
jgi:APA family basic amino acid/polyamine antiporter